MIKSKAHNISPADVSALSMDKKEWCLLPYEVLTDEERAAEACYKGD